MCPVRIARFSLTCLLLALPLSTPPLQARSQQARAGQDTAQVPSPPAVIPVSGILQRADVAQSALRVLQDRLGQRDAATTVIESLPAFIETLNAALEDPIYSPGEGASLRTLDGTRRRWAPFQARLSSWKGVLDPRAQVLAAQRDSLLQTRQIWERTRVAAIEEAAPEALLGRTASLLAEIDDTYGRLNERLESVLSARDQVSQGQRSVEEILSRIESAEAVAQERLFIPDSPLLWRAIRAEGNMRTLIGEVGASWRQTRGEWNSYVRGSSDQLVFWLGAFAVFLVLLQTLRRQATAWIEGGQGPPTSSEFEGATRVLDRPLSAAALLTALLWRLTYETPSVSVGAIVMVVLVVPVWRLLPASITRDLRRPMFAFASLWVFCELVILAIDGSLLQRLSLLLIASLVGAGLYRAVRPDSPVRSFVTHQGWPVALGLGYAGIAVMGASIVANVIGMTTLAELLTRATITSAILAMVLATMVTVLDGLIPMLLSSGWARRLNVVRRHSGILAARGRKLAHVGLFFLWFGIVLTQFGIQRRVFNLLGGALRADLSPGTATISLGDILAFGLVLWLSLMLARGIRVLLEEDVLRSVTLPRGVPTAISTLVYYGAVFVGFLMAAAAAGFDLSRFTLLAGAFGVGLGFGLQNVVNNFVSGLILIFERPIQVGDVVDVGGVQGQVQRIGIRASTVRTWSGAEVIVPNGDLISQQVTNWTLSDRLRRMEIPVGVRYGTDPERVINLLSEAVSHHPEVLPNPAVTTLFLGFGESSLDFVVRAWTSSDDWRVVQSDLAVEVNRALKEAGIEIPFPQRDLHLRSVHEEIGLKGRNIPTEEV